MRRLVLARSEAPRRALVVFLKGMVDTHAVERAVVEPLLTQAISGDARLTALAYTTLQAIEWVYTTSPSQALDLMLRGYTLLLVDGAEGALLLGTLGGVQRDVKEPPTEPTVRGPRDGFVESLPANWALLRRRLVNPALRFETVPIGRETQTRVSIAYLQGTAALEVLDEVRRRLRHIDTSGVLDAGMVLEWIEDNPWSPFPQLDYTERPDKTAAALLAGRVAVMVDQSPGVILAPTVFWHFIQVTEDYYERWWAATVLRFLRVLVVFLSLTLPALWVTLVAFHQELLPTPLALSIAAGRERVPLPVVLELLLLEVTIEILREAGVRLPRGIGQAVSIVGGLVIGEAAVRAGLVSPDTVIIVAATVLASFSTPSFSLAYAFRLLRIFLLLLAGTLGVVGLGVGLTLVLLHLLSLKSFGVEYLSPLLPHMPRGASETLVRPAWRWLKRPARRWWQR